ncbi:MAG: hypothetical protein ACO20H_03825 [Bacteriovoracaceae bacterium]
MIHLLITLLMTNMAHGSLKERSFLLKGLKVDKIYRSMQGPRKQLTLNKKDFGTNTFWIKEFSTDVYSSKTKEDSLEFLCHISLTTYNEGNLVALAQGLNTLKFPDGFALKASMSTDKNAFLNAQVLNNNYTDIDKEIDFKANIKYLTDSEAKKQKIKPLHFGFVGSLCPVSDCKPVHMHDHKMGHSQPMTSHWYVPPGTHSYKNKIKLDSFKGKNIKIHYIWLHLHPYGESLSLKNISKNKVVWKGYAQNHKEKELITNLDYYSSSKGILVDPNDEYEVEMIVNNRTKRDVDTMGAFWVYYSHD